MALRCRRAVRRCRTRYDSHIHTTLPSPIRANVVAGYAPGGTPPTGYRTERIEAGVKRDGQPRIVSKWLIDEDKAERVKQAFAMCAAGYTYEEIHAATGLLRSKASYWSMFRNRSYLGILKFGKEEFPGALPALIDETTYKAVQARLGSRQESAKKARRRGSDYLLSGLLMCGRCGSAMVGQRNGRRAERGSASWPHYRCSGQQRLGAAACDAPHISADDIEHKVVNIVLDEVLTPANSPTRPSASRYTG